MTKKGVQHKRSSVAGNIPSPTDLTVGELAINFVDRYVYTKNGANAVIRLNSNVYVSTTAPSGNVVGDAYVHPTTGKLFVYFSLNGAGEAWNEIAPPENLSAYLQLVGGSMSGPIVLSGTATGNEAIGFNQVNTLVTATLGEYLKKDGSVSMTGRLTLSADPTSGLHAATKAYVDNAVSIATPDLTAYLAKVGGVMTGQITLPGGGTGNQAATANELASAVAAHVALPDPHTQYLLDTQFATHKATGASEHPAVTTSVNGFMSAADKTRFDTVVVATESEFITGTNNTKFLSPLAAKPVLREKLKANKTIYFRTDGNDANDGSANDSSHAKLTIQSAYDLAKTYDLNGFKITIQCGQTSSVTFTAGVTMYGRLVGQLRDDDLEFIGNITTPANCVVTVSVASTACFQLFNGAACKVTAFEGRTTIASSAVFWLASSSRMILGSGMRFGAATNHHVFCENSYLYIANNYSVVGSAGIHMNCTGNSSMIHIDNAPTVTITPTATHVITIYYMAQIGGYIAAGGVTYTGTLAATSVRYSVTNAGKLFVNGATASVPGTSAGSGTDFHTSPYGWVK